MRYNIVISPGGNDTPCRECQTRSTNCHIDCEKYRAWRVAKDSHLESKARYQEINSWTRSKYRTCQEWLKSRGDWWRK